MAQFASSDDFAVRLGETLTDDELFRAGTLLARASGLIQDEAKQRIELVTGDVLTMPGTTDDMLLLPERPVVKVISVTLDGVPLLEGGDWYRDGNAIFRRPASLTIVGALDAPTSFPLGTGFGWPGQTLAITYTHGYEDPPETVKTICMEAVVRVWVNPGSVARESVGDTHTVYDNNRFSPAGLLLSDVEKQAIRRVFGRAGKSVTIGR